MKITATDTAKVPNTSATAASSGSDLNGMAVKAACDDDPRAAWLPSWRNGRRQTQASVVRFEGGQVHVGTDDDHF